MNWWHKINYNSNNSTIRALLYRIHKIRKSMPSMCTRSWIWSSLSNRH